MGKEILSISCYIKMKLAEFTRKLLRLNMHEVHVKSKEFFVQKNDRRDAVLGNTNGWGKGNEIEVCGG